MFRIFLDLFKSKGQRLADAYIRCSEAERNATENKRAALDALRKHVSDTGDTPIGNLYAYQKNEIPTLNLDDTKREAFEKDLLGFNLKYCFTDRLSIPILRDAIELGKDKTLLKVVAKHKVEVIQLPRVHFKRNP